MAHNPAKIPHSRHHQPETLALAWMLGIYIFLCVAIAGLNYGMAPKAPPPVREAIATAWHLYENQGKFLFMAVAAWLAWRLDRKTRHPHPMRPLRRNRNLLGFCISALLLHVIAPALSSNSELYFFAMPLPWTTVPLQVMDPSSNFAASRRGQPLWGATGLAIALGLWAGISLIVLAGTLVRGRRWQCSTLCLFNGFAAEIFAPVMPLIPFGQGSGSRTPAGARVVRKVFTVLRWTFLAIALGFTAWWIARLAGFRLPPETEKLLETLELIKYMSAELLMAMVFWVVLGGRGYCQYCSLGTVLALASRMAGQRIDTDRSHCTGCGACTRTCPMGIDIAARARQGLPVTDLRCTGCGRCEDRCPTGTLRYTTHASAWLDARKEVRIRSTTDTH